MTTMAYVSKHIAADKKIRVTPPQNHQLQRGYPPGRVVQPPPPPPPPPPPVCTGKPLKRVGYDPVQGDSASANPAASKLMQKLPLKEDYGAFITAISGCLSRDQLAASHNDRETPKSVGHPHSAVFKKDKK